MSKERRLGRGLEALLGRSYGALETNEVAAPPAAVTVKLAVPCQFSGGV